MLLPVSCDACAGVGPSAIVPLRHGNMQPHSISCLFGTDGFHQCRSEVARQLHSVALASVTAE
jgi:hypothetical protein